MHQYLRSIGFSRIQTKKELRKLLNDVIVNSTKKEYMQADDDGIVVEYSKNYSPSCGITLRAEYDETENLTLDFYYPYVTGEKASTTEDVAFERRTENESYAGLLEDVRVGVTLIYYVQNGMYLKKNLSDENFQKLKITTSFSALCLKGTILLPIKKDPVVTQRLKKATDDRNKRIIAAKNGDEEAIEQLTLEDIDIYSAVSKKIITNDVFTLVDSYFMPCGVECDHYSILGEIEDFRLETNYITNEQVYLLNVECNNLPLSVCVNKEDLLGEPQIGRRFRGNIWLQGTVSV